MSDADRCPCARRCLQLAFVTELAMDPIVITLSQLRGMIGLRVRYEGQPWQVIEVLEDGPSLVLEAVGQARVLQADQYGEKFRWVPQQVTVVVLTADGTELHPDFLSLDLI